MDDAIHAALVWGFGALGIGLAYAYIRYVIDRANLPRE